MSSKVLEFTPVWMVSVNDNNEVNYWLSSIENEVGYVYGSGKTMAEAQREFEKRLKEKVLHK